MSEYKNIDKSLRNLGEVKESNSFRILPDVKFNIPQVDNTNTYTKYLNNILE